MGDWFCFATVLVLIAGTTTAAYFDLRKWIVKNEMQRRRFDLVVKHGVRCDCIDKENHIDDEES